ncbi:MAG: hypothetical protein AAGF11_38370 [Myxococcota bacterium]
MTDLGSRSDLEALRRSGRGKVITLLVVLVVAVGAAGWYFFGRTQGQGNAEDPAKIMVVARTPNYAVALQDMGFEVASGTFEAWEQKATEEVPNLESTGLLAIMTLADRFGYGYVVFDQPQTVDFSVLDVEDVPQMPEHVRFAVLSAGDLAFPHVMTVNPEPSAVMHGASVVLLQALFEQPQLREALPGEGSSSMASIQLRDRLREGIDRLERIPEAERMADKIVGQVRQMLGEDERAEPKPSLLGQALESGSPFALANGQILTISRGFTVVTRDAVRADLKLDDTERMLVGAPGVEADARIPCEALAGGSVSVHENARYTMADDGQALLVKTLSDGLTLWTLDATAPGCVFTRKGSIPAPAPGLDGAMPAGHGQVARAGQVGRQGVVSVVTAGQDDELMLGMLDDVELSRVAWLSDRHLVAIGDTPEASSLYVFDTQTPLSVLRLPSTVFENAEELFDVAVGKRGPRPTLVVTAGDWPRKIYRLDLPEDLSALLSAPPVDPAAVEAQAELTADRQTRGLPVVHPLDTNRFVATALTHEGRVRDPAVSADGRWVAFSLRGEAVDPPEPGDSEIAVLPTAGGSLQVLTRNALRDHQPRLTPDGSHVVFKTRLEIPKTDWKVTAPRVAAVAQ